MTKEGVSPLLLTRKLIKSSMQRLNNLEDSGRAKSQEMAKRHKDKV